ncbi:hypothetical protein HZC07_00240 [Candidatus Micrarchaeota archaeon]|nr:hypothetical protein [Candidatus Micrarchaeota archaeon]
MDTYQIVNNAFKKTCKIIFREEVGELMEFSDYLSGIVNPTKKTKSKLSGRSIVTANYYPSNAKFISAEESDNLRQEKIDIDSVKDIDSLVEAVKEKFTYSGNRIFGTNMHLSEVDNATNCQYVINGHNIIDVKYGSSIAYMRECEYVFGAVGNPESEYLLLCSEGVNLKRSFESYSCTNSSDLYYCFRCDSSSNCMFSFGLSAKRHSIGNNILNKEKYTSLKEKLVKEIADELKNKKKMPYLIELPQEYEHLENDDAETVINYNLPSTSLNQAFRNTTKIVLGKQLPSIENSSEWLNGINIFNMKKINGASGKPVVKHSQGGFGKLHPKRLVSEMEFFEIAEKTFIPIEEKKLDGVLNELAKKIYFTCDLLVQPSSNIVDSPLVFRSNDTYVAIAVSSKYIAYTIAAKSEYVFGGLGRVLRSNFDLNCYDSTNISQCLEVDGSHNTSDSMFCHNCEGVRNGIFTYNMKGKNYVVGNTPVNREDYLRVRKIVTGEVLRRVEKKEEVEELHLFSFSR